MKAAWPAPGPIVDVAKLDRGSVVGPRTPLFWGTLLLVAIEATCFAILFTTYFYVRNNFVEWPPEQRLRLLPGALPTGALLLTLIPTHMYRKAACTHRFKRMRALFVIATVLSFLSVAARAFEIYALPFSWTGSAYASVVWTSIGLHTLEIATSAAESAFLCAVLFRRRIEVKTFEDVEASGLFSYFSILVWLPFALVFYLDGRLG